VKRLLATLVWDVRLQYRNGFYAAAAVVAVIGAALLFRFDKDLQAYSLPVIFLQNLAVNAFYFIGALVLLEKDEGTLSARVITPLRKEEFLASKVLSLTGLSLLESAVLAALIYGIRLNWAALLSGVALLAVMLALYGFLVVARYDSLNAYLMPSVLYLLILMPPLLDYFGVLKGAWVYLHPVHGPLVLLQAAFRPVAAWQWVYGLLYSGLWIGLLWRWARRDFYRYIIEGAGV